VREAAGGRPCGHLFDDPASSRLLDRCRDRGAIEPGCAGDDGELEHWAADGRDLDHRARLGREPRHAVVDELPDPLGATELCNRPGERHVGLFDLQPAAVDKLAPELTEQQRRTVGELPDRIEKLRARVCTRRVVDERAHIFGAEARERDSRHTFEA
jgi:hypothetical protein